MHESLAIVGMACRLPGADGLEAFWNLVVHGRTAWGRLPDSRLPRDLYFDPEKGKVGKSYSEMGALVSERPADPAVCPIRPDMIDRYDIAHHIFLEVASQACRDAGLDPFAMPKHRRTGVYVGHTGGSTRIGDYVYSTGIDGTATWLSEVEAARELLGADAEEVAAEVTAAVRRDHPGRRPGQKLDLGALGAAKIVREALGLDGPYLVVDAACASSLQALAIAARALDQGGIDQAIVGGASYCKSDSLVLFSAAQSVSNSGSCPFGRGADGLVTAEGYVALVIKTLPKAIADGDRIRAVIRGIGVASDGKGKSLWAPRQEGQKLAVERAYPDKSEIGRLDYIEAHATSTQVGDATELGALSSLVSAHVPAGKKIPIGSVKANIGHTLETAGMASLVKVVLAMEHGMIPPGSTCQEYNEEFDWERGPFTVPGQPLSWPRRADGEARRAAVNAFGIGGLNVHLAITEHLPGRSVAAAMPRPRAAADDDAVAIVGMGSVLPGALSMEAFRAVVRQGESVIGAVPASRFNLSRALDPSAPRTWHTVAGVGGFVEGFAYDWRRHKVPPKQIAAANPLQFMLLEAADAAIAELGGVASLDRIRTGVVVGTMFGGEFSNDLQMGLRLPETSRHLRAALSRRGFAARDVERIVEGYGKKLLEKMPALVDETGSFTSSTLASRLTKSFDLMGGALALDSGDCSGVSALSAAIDLLRQRDCDAVLCASGQRFLDLTAFEELSLAGLLADAPASPLAGGRAGRVPGEGAVVMVLKRLADARSAGNRIHGVIRGVSVGSGASVAGAASRVVREARMQAGIVPSAVKAMEISGSGTGEIDEPEFRAVAAEYGVEAVAGAVEGIVGHLGAAAAAASVIKLVDVLASGHMPPMVAGGAARPGMRVASSEPVALPAVDASGYRAGCVTVVHGTQVGHVVMDNGRPVPAAAQEQGVMPEAAAIAAPAPRALPHSKPAGRPLVAALFPGQGSQYTDMFRGLLADSPLARHAAESLDGMARAAGFETLAGIAWQPVNGMGTVVWDTQWGMYLGDLLAWKVLEGMGFAPDLIASHSFGEFPSLVAAGAWSFEEGARATKARADAVAQFGPKQGAMVSVIARREEVAAAIAPFADQVWVCAENAPEQSVIGGHARAVDAVEVLLEGRRIRSKRLAVPSPFHTPLLAAAAAKLAEAIARIRIVSPARRVYSSTTAAPLVSIDDVRQSLVRQMTQTVRWVEVVEKLWAEGVRTFVEVGPSGVLTGLTRRILEGREGATFVQFDQRGRDAAGHLAKVREQLLAAGAIVAAGAATAVAAATPVARSATVLAFDATARRRARNRAGGAGRPATAGKLQEKPAFTAANGHGDASGHHGSAPQGPAVVQAVVVKPVSVPVTPASAVVNRIAVAVPAKQAVVRFAAADELENYLVEFVVDQTGYPKEIVELDADLEGDLGIDSIRKAQLFGEIGQRYGLSADASVSLDDFRTLRHLLDYMLPRVGGKIDQGSPASRPAPASTAAETALRAGHATNGHATNGHASNGHASNGHAKPAAGTVLAEAPAVRVGNGGDLEAFLVEFVVDQTGYPKEIVELDADLEGDLGIDSIRKAQLFGEIGQRYGLSADASVSLDDFRTLRHLLDYMLPRVGGGASVVAAASVSPVEMTPQWAPAAAPLASAAAATSTAQAPVAAPGGDLEAFLVEFVIDQTGYPKEIVELDADLEGDLGIDSIRKAQLFGEIGQRYGLSADASVSLDDFRTLRHLLDYMLPRVGGGAASSAPAPGSESIVPQLPSSDAAQAAVIRQWTREFAAAAPSVLARVKISADIAARLQATAAATGIDGAVLEAAMASPTVALGGLDAVLSVAGDNACGIAVGFGRHASPSCVAFADEGVSGHLVGVEGLPGGVVAWNDAGLVLVAGRGAGVAGGLSVSCAIERLARCRTVAEVATVATTVAPISGTILATADGVIGLIGGDGRVVDGGVRWCDAAALSPLVRVAGDAAGHVDFGRILGETGAAGVRDGLSATATWLAAGAVNGSTVAFSGGPRGIWLPATAATALAGAWRGSVAAPPPAEHRSMATEVTGRFGIALAEIPPAVASRNLAGERVLILAGTDPAGRTLAAELGALIAAMRAEAIVVALDTTAEVRSAIDAAESRGPVRHLLIAAPWSAAEDWVAVRESAVNAGYFACQRWLAARARAGDGAKSTLTAITGLGGDFGAGGAIGSVVGGAYAGLFKGLAREYADVEVRVVDFSTADSAPTIAPRVIAEIGSKGPVEVGYRGGERRTVIAVEGAPRQGAGLAGLARGSVWLVTGGARGVTAACARALGSRHGLNLVLVGSTRPLPVDEAWLTLDEAGIKALKGRVMLDAKARGSDPRRAWRDVEKSIEIASGLAKFRAAGVTARYEPCDLADGAAVRRLVGWVEREVGPIRGIVHGAGWESACKFEKKTAEGLEATLGPKCVGLEHVVAAVDPRSLESVVAFGSTSGRLGGLGQADYSLANDMLAKIIGRLRGGGRGLRATVFHWHAWDEVGMASRPESRFVLEQFGMKFMPLAEGVGRFMAEIEAGLPEAEVLVTEPVFCLDALSASAAHAHAPPAPNPARAQGSLVASVERAGLGTNVKVVLDPTTDRFLTEHLQYKRPLLPAVMGAELLAQATIAAGVCQRVEEIRDFVVERPIGFPTDQSRQVRIDIEDAADGQVSARGWTAVRGNDGREADVPRVHLSATVLAGAADRITETLDEMPFPFNPMIYQDDAPLWHGPGFRTLSGLFLDRSGGWGRLTAPDPDAIAKPRGAGGWTVPIAMLDGAIVACAVYSFILFRKRVEVPLRFDRLRITGEAATGEKCTVRLWFRSQDPRESIYDFVIYGADGRALVALEGLHLAIVSPERSKPS